LENKLTTLKIAVFAEDFETFSIRKKQILQALGSQNPHIYWCRSKEQSRLDFIHQHPKSWILFLDHDCELTEASFQYVERKIQESNAMTVFAGVYRNPENSTYLQRSHNLIANSWLRNSFLTGKKTILGGAFLLFSGDFNKQPQGQFPLFWGGEDQFLARVLVNLGFVIELLPSFEVVHHTDKRLCHFLRRAWFHGKHDVEYLDQGIKFQNLKTYLNWSQKVEMSDFYLAPAVGLHFLIQKVAKLFQLIRQQNKKKES
jgi:GT2 family glycosyltransferase